jgi:hypothetical protein
MSAKALFLAKQKLAAMQAAIVSREAANGDWTQWLGPTESGAARKPTEKQRTFLDVTCFESLYGGAAGGGKSDALLMAALEYVHMPRYAALILRRSFADLALPGAIMDRAKAWLIPKGVGWNAQDKRFTFPSGASLQFGYCENDRDKYRYQGAELQFVAVDELTQWPESSYTYLLSRLRRLEGSQVPLRARAASNPGGVGHTWVKGRFVDSREPGAFVPANLADNPFVDQQAYLQSLSRLDPITRRQLLEGIWVQDSAGLVYRQFEGDRNTIRALPIEDPKRQWTYMLGLDFGVVDQNALTVVAFRDHDPCVYIVLSYRFTALPPEMAREVIDLNAQYKFARIVGDVGGLGKAYAEQMRQYFHIPVQPAEKNDKAGYISMLNGDLARSRIMVVSDACGELIDEWRSIPWDASRTHEADGVDNHCADSCLYVWRACTAAHNAPLVPEPVRGSREAAQKQADRWQREDEESSPRKREYWDDLL